MPDFMGDLRGIVKDLVQRQAKFGSYKASVSALKAKYPHESIYDQRVSVFYGKENEPVAYADELFEKKYIHDYQAEHKNVSHVYYQTQPGEDKFDVISICLSGHYFEIKDANKNGIVDENDTIDTGGYLNIKTTTVGKILGLNSK